MANEERIRRLAQQLKGLNRDAEGVREQQLDRARLLSKRGMKFWKTFLQELTDSIGILNRESAWEPIESLQHALSNDQLSVDLFKRNYPYVRSRLTLELQHGCIRGAFCHAPERPTEARIPETPVWIDLEVNETNQIYPAIDGKKIADAEGLAADLLEWFLTGSQPSRGLI